MNRFNLYISVFFVLFTTVVLGGCRDDEPSKPIPEAPQVSTPPEKATFVGAGVCAGCHRSAYEAWQGSHHALAMQEADQQTVLGDFQEAIFKRGDQTSRFYQNDQGFMIQTDGPDGRLRDYRIGYTFGIQPLQQYLIPFPNGRFQALSLAWDTRPKETGGQRWFHLYPDETIVHSDSLHWTGPNQNWNYMCADCHSTNLQKHYDLSQDSYHTTWSDLNVGCEACHGPGSHHVEWARLPKSETSSKAYTVKGLSPQFPAYKPEVWQIAPDAQTAERQEKVIASSEIDVCAHCHSRRTLISENFQAGQPFLNHYVPALLDERLYHADGQISEEVYVYGSFLQSKMYQKGVTCHDCHEPHGLQLRTAGNVLCTRCHRTETFDTPSHHFHQPDTVGAQCVECHMPAKTYMVIDPRRDHSLRIPRPDLSVKLGTPNACTQCHKNRTAQWAAEEVKKRYGDPGRDGFHYGEVLEAGRTGKAGADALLATLAQEKAKPGIVRASAFSLLGGNTGPTTIEAIMQGLQDDDPLVRIGALRALDRIDPKNRYALARHLLTDKIRAVRIEAGRHLASIPLDTLSQSEQTTLNQAVDDYLQAQWAIAERPEAHMNRGIVFSDRRQWRQAEEAYRLALKQDETFYPALVNLADVYRLQERDPEGEVTLRKALTLAPQDANVHHALGLLLVRVGKKVEALEMLGQAAILGPENPRHGYVYAVALHSGGQTQKALSVLEQTLTPHPHDRDLLYLLTTLYREQGNVPKARQHAETLLALAPQDADARQLVEALRLTP